LSGEWLAGRQQLFAADTVAIPVEMNTVSWVIAHHGCGASRPRFTAVFVNATAWNGLLLE